MNSPSERLARLSPQKLALLQKTMHSGGGGNSEPIAIVGMGCRFAGASNVPQYWRLIRESIDMTGEIPPSRWDVDQFYDPVPGTPGKMPTRWGGFLDEIDCFDATFFGISPREAEKMDPQQRLLLEVVWEALEYGGILPSGLRQSATGVFVGIGGVDYSRIPVRFGSHYYETVTAYSGTGNALSIAANRISYTLDLRGPSMSIDTACSSSLVAAHLAIRSLRSHECSMAIVGGVNAILTPETTLAFSQAQMLSPEGKCRPFDHRANGYVRGEGCGVVVLKRLSDAVRDGDLVFATILGSAINQDGLTSGITAPRATAQVEVIRQALRDAHRSSDEVSYIEAHGTATPLGDPIEVSALAEVFRAGKTAALPPCYFGSVKGNIGHTETAAGIASLIKTALMLRHRQIPSQIHFQQLNPHIDLSGSRLEVAAEPRPWDHHLRTRVAGISSFGFGGTNAHLVLEEASVPPPKPATSDRPQHVLTLSAKSPDRLRALAGRLREALRDDPELAVADLCYTAGTGRTHLTHRLAIPVRESGEVVEALERFAMGEESPAVRTGKARTDRPLRVAFLFPGQGAQFPGMGQTLYQNHPVFRAALEECDAILADLLPERLLKVLFADSSTPPRVHQTRYTQPALFAIEYALSRMWRSMGIEPTVMIGHSIGDYVAACEAGVFSLADGLTLIAHRGRLVQQIGERREGEDRGRMAAVFASREQVAEGILPYAKEIGIAVHNGPSNVVISGSSQRVSEVLALFQSAGIKSRILEVSHAMHSPLLDPILDEFERFAQAVTYHSPKLPLISSRDGREADDRLCDPRFWRDHLRSTVCFVEAVQTLQSFAIDAALEVGPGSTLCGLAKGMWEGAPVSWLPSLRSGHDAWGVIGQTISELAVQGTAIDWQAFDRPWPRKRQVLPTYPFERQSHWYDRSLAETAGTVAPRPRGGDLHPLLGQLLPVAGLQTIFETVFTASSPAFLADHCVDHNPVFPATAYVEQGLAAARQVFGEGQHTLKELSIQQAMVFPADQRREVQVHLGPEQRGERSFEVFSRPSTARDDRDPAWTLHAAGTLQAERGASAPAPEPIDLATLRGRLVDSIPAAAFYEQMAACKLQYGPRFQVLSELSTGQTEALGRIEWSGPLAKEADGYLLHPAILDGCLQSMAGVIAKAQGEDEQGSLLLPTAIERVCVREPSASGTFWVSTRLRPRATEEGTFVADLDLVTAKGAIVAEIRGARVQRVARSHTAPSTESHVGCYDLRWEQAAPPNSPRDPSLPAAEWLLVADAEGFAAEFAARLRDRGAHVAVLATEASAIDEVRLREGLGADSGEPLVVVDFRGIDARDPLDDAGQRGVDLSAAALELLQMLATSKAIASRKIARTVIVTAGAVAVEPEDAVWPAQSALWGLGKTAFLELPHLAICLLDLDPAASRAEGIAVLERDAVAIGGLRDGDGEREDHVAYRGGHRYFGRLQEVPSETHEPRSGAGRQLAVPAGRFSLRVGATSSLDALHYEPQGARELGPSDVEIAVQSTGLNFSDVLKAIGLYPGMKDEIVPLGIECAGIVTRVGAAVTRFVPGERVMGVAPYSFASHAISPEYALVATPENLTDEQAATIPITFLTAFHALCGLGRLARGEKVLIHAGAGGVGLAAIQIAQEIGAEIFATAGSEDKRRFLRDLGVAHVMDSRSLDFADQILEITAGQGVDVVLNSLPGEAITKSLSVLAAYGRFLEIGKTDIYQNRRIGLWPFQDNLSYFAIDLDRMLRQRPAEIEALYRQIMPHFAAGRYRPLPLQAFARDEVIDAYRWMAQRKNIGKVVVSMVAAKSQSHGPRDGAMETQRWAMRGTILITGGLGALGQHVARWVMDQGGTHLAILSRRPPAELQTEADAIARDGVSVALLQGDVGDATSLAAALQSLPESFPAIQGVFHIAGVLRDGLLLSMERTALVAAMEPKTRGAWNLHQALPGPLDCFVMFSSVAGTIGSPGQANYAAGNAFLDGLAHYRRQRGEAALSIAWGPWGAAGMAASAEVQRHLSERGMRPLAPEVAIEQLELALHGEGITRTIVDVDWQQLLAKLPGGGSSLLRSFRPADGGAEKASRRGGRDESLCTRLSSLDSPQRIELLEPMIAQTLSDVTGVDAASIEVDQPLASLGLDSLMAMELRSRVEGKLGIEIPVASLFDEPTVASLARVASQAFQPAATIAGASSPSAAGAATGDSSPATTAGRYSHKLSHRSELVGLGGSLGTRPPLFCIHPVGGDLRCYEDFARGVQGRWVYGLRAQGLQASSQAPETMDQLVSDYMTTIREAAGGGPYTLLGWSTGGIFAYEIARRFRAEGEDVAPLVMVDTPLPAIFDRVDLNDSARFLYDLVEFANYFAGTSMTLTYEGLRQLSAEESIDLVLGEAIANRVLPPQTTRGHLERIIHVCKQHVRLLKSYVPVPSDLVVHLLRPEDRQVLSEAAKHTEAEDLGWGAILAVQTHQVPGHHFSMITGERGARLAAELDRWLDSPVAPTRPSLEQHVSGSS